jgi:predicted AlkP superfamily phosphohydrolase/phosphomutase
VILVLALDAFDPDLWVRFQSEGRLPNLSRLAQAGFWGRLRSSHPPVSVPAWSTFLTGVGPGTHGMFDFTRLEGDRIRFQNATDRRVPTLLELADAAGLRVCSIGLPTTYPVPALERGALLAGFDSPLTATPDARGMHPLPLWRELRREGIDLRASTLPEGRKSHGWHARAARELLASVERRVAQTLAVLRRGPWDLVLVHFQAADTAGHHFFRYFDPESPRHNAAHSSRARVIPDIYAALDGAVGRLLEACPGGVRCLVVSDHGMGAASDCVIHLNRWLEDEGFLVRRRSRGAGLASAARQFALRRLPRGIQAGLFRRLRQGPVARLESATRLGSLDLEASSAFSEESSTLPGIWLRDLRAREDLLRRLRSWEAVRRVHRREDLYRGPARQDAPHLLLELRHSLVRTPPGYRGPAVRRLEPRELDGERGTGLNGVHRPEGILIAGYAAASGAQLSGAWIGDLAPTLLAALGAPIPAWMEGVPLTGLAPEPKWVEQPMPPAPVSRHRMTRPEAERVARRLRALGYLG